MQVCLVCQKRKEYPICFSCGKDAFSVEECRKVLAEKNDLKKLEKMYTSSYVEINNTNTSSFWNGKLKNVEKIYNQDGMTKDRIAISVSYIPKTAKKVLDIGAGYGFLEEKIAAKNYSYELCGFDISSEAINNLKKRFKGRFTIASIYNPPYQHDYFDVILALEVLEHIPPSKILNVLKKISDILKSGGIFILSIPLNEGLKHKKVNPSGHLREYSRELISAELSLSGFKVIDYQELFAFNSFYKFKKILQQSIFKHKWKPNDIVIKAIKL